MQVATNAGPGLIPAAARIAGLTKMTYAMVKKVVKQAKLSVRKLALLTLN